MTHSRSATTNRTQQVLTTPSQRRLRSAVEQGNEAIQKRERAQKRNPDSWVEGGGCFSVEFR